MDVARPAVLGVEKQVGDQFDDGGVVTRILVDLDPGGFVALLIHASRIKHLEFPIDQVRDCADKLNGTLQEKPETVEGLEIHRVGDRQNERSVALGDRDGLVPAGVFGTQESDKVGGWGDMGEIDEVYPVLRGKRLGHILLAHDLFTDQCLDHVEAGRFPANLLDLLLRQQADILEDLDDVVVVGGHVRGASPVSSTTFPSCQRSPLETAVDFRPGLP